MVAQDKFDYVLNAANMDSRSSDRRSMKSFNDMANTYNRGQYRGPTGWPKLRYALQLRFDMQGP